MNDKELAAVLLMADRAVADGFADYSTSASRLNMVSFGDGGCTCCRESVYSKEAPTPDQKRQIAEKVIAAWAKWAGIPYVVTEDNSKSMPSHYYNTDTGVHEMFNGHAWECSECGQSTENHKLGCTFFPL